MQNLSASKLFYVQKQYTCRDVKLPNQRLPVYLISQSLFPLCLDGKEINTILNVVGVVPALHLTYQTMLLGLSSLPRLSSTLINEGV